ALKVLPYAAMLDQRQLTRFRNEARAAAALHHHNIVPVHSIGCERGVHYYAMQYIEGESLARIIDQLSQLKQESSGTGGSRTKDSKPGENGNYGHGETDLATDSQRLAALSRSLTSEGFASEAIFVNSSGSGESPPTTNWRSGSGAVTPVSGSGSHQTSQHQT